MRFLFATVSLLAFCLTTPVIAAHAEDAKPAVEQKAEDKSAQAKAAKISNKDATAAQGEALPANDTDENKLPPYPENAMIATGKFQSYTVGEEDTFLDIARHFNLGYVELRAANPTVDPWSPTPGTEMLIPTFSLLPRAPQEGIVVNLGKMRLYYYETPGEAPESFAIGIGREGLSTPVGETTIVRKVDGPSWYPTDRMRKEKAYLPKVIGPGPSNPLGTHALYLGWPTFLIHGSNKPWGIGRRVSSGCMRLYPEDIVTIFSSVPVGTKVTVVDQPILVGWYEGNLYLEANPSQTQSNDIDFDNEMTIKLLTDGMKKEIIKTAGDHAKDLDWAFIEEIVKQRRGYPIAIYGSKFKEDKTAFDKAPRPVPEGTPVDTMPENRKRQQQWQQ